MTLANNILRTDSYKVTHWKQYPPKTTNLTSYFESRGGDFPEAVFCGLQYYIDEYLSKPVTMEDIDRAEEIFKLHFGRDDLFNREGWERIVKMYGGYLPIRIKAVPEGTVVPVSNVLMTIENTDMELPWTTNYAETMLVKTWYPTTVATLSRSIRKLILKYLERNGNPDLIDFKLHDFGYRGVSSEESAAIGGWAHLLNFKGTDTIIALEFARQYYDERMAGYSIPAAEHSTITAWGMSFEYEAYENMIKQFGNGSLYAVVSDSYNIYNACDNIWGTQLKKKVLESPATLVVRPDSGIPHKVVLEVAEILGSRYGYTVNEKGYKILNKVRIIQGDGVNYNEIDLVLSNLEQNGWSSDNIAFGMGGALLQKLHRDTLQFAFKACSVTVNKEVRDVYKDPITDTGKVSKRGKLKLIETDNGYQTVSVHTPGKDVMELIWENGIHYKRYTMNEIRERIKSHE